MNRAAPYEPNRNVLLYQLENQTLTLTAGKYKSITFCFVQSNSTLEYRKYNSKTFQDVIKIYEINVIFCSGKQNVPDSDVSSQSEEAISPYRTKQADRVLSSVKR